MSLLILKIRFTVEFQELVLRKLILRNEMHLKQVANANEAKFSVLENVFDPNFAE